MSSSPFICLSYWLSPRTMLPLRAESFLWNSNWESSCIFYVDVGLSSLNPILISLVWNLVELSLERAIPMSFAGIVCSCSIHWKLMVLYKCIMKDRRRRTEENEWESIKILHRNLAYIPTSTRRPSLLTRPRSHSYSEAIGPRNRARNRSRNTEQC
jgi:hypothetical protein